MHIIFQQCVFTADVFWGNLLSSFLKKSIKSAVKRNFTHKQFLICKVSFSFYVWNYLDICFNLTLNVFIFRGVFWFGVFCRPDTLFFHTVS